MKRTFSCNRRWFVIYITIAATVNNPFSMFFGHTIPSSWYCWQSCLVILFCISCTLENDVPNPSTANFSTNDFFLVFACTINHIFTGRGGLFFFEWLVAPLVSLLCFTVLNLLSWPHASTPPPPPPPPHHHHHHHGKPDLYAKNHSYPSYLFPEIL